MNFFKDLNPIGRIFCFLFLVTYLWTQILNFRGLLVNIDSVVFLDDSTLVYNLLIFILGIFGFIYAWKNHQNIQNLKIALLISFFYMSLFYLVTLGTTALHPGFSIVEDQYFRIDIMAAGQLLFFFGILDPLFRRFFKNQWIKIVLQIIAFNFVPLIFNLICFFILSSIFEINVNSYHSALKRFDFLIWPSAWAIIGAVVMHFYGLIAAWGLFLSFCLFTFFRIYFSVSWVEFSFNTIIAYFVVGAVFYKLSITPTNKDALMDNLKP